MHQLRSHGRAVCYCSDPSTVAQLDCMRMLASLTSCLGHLQHVLVHCWKPCGAHAAISARVSSACKLQSMQHEDMHVSHQQLRMRTSQRRMRVAGGSMFVQSHGRPVLLKHGCQCGACIHASRTMMTDAMHWCAAAPCFCQNAKY